ncbi:hypothetical protein HN51_042825 [Arachis hypogaea]|uniref:DVL protein n=1 Tax=Arachis hypogaea TaxID=3818 RepID=A0A444Y8B0_ARAHY|nr:uncharacterized protein LOC107612045 [Arachis ipaensis]XP_025673879.1 uncharacterized protein LOC112773054 [Arachis hypogaea]QHN94980.1 uncharacterized protein DS421_18g605740 [Arachis hypogaea]RYQ98143.1 hypothetical protein Ahy_B08g094214 [Arachis hypogaea]
MDGKWKVSKQKETTSSKFSRSCSTRSTTSNSPLLMRSISHKSSSSSSKCNNNNNLQRSFSQKNTSSPASIGRKCTNIAKEHKARFYIMRRCVAMLVCWHKHGDS